MIFIELYKPRVTHMMFCPTPHGRLVLLLNVLPSLNKVYYYYYYYYYYYNYS